MREAALNKKVKDWINTIPGAWAYKRLGSVGNKGMPDVSGHIRAVRIELEGKLPGEKPTPKQAYFIAKFQADGVIAGWYTSLEEAQQIVVTQAAWHGIHLEQVGRIWRIK